MNKIIICDTHTHMTTLSSIPWHKLLSYFLSHSFDRSLACSLFINNTYGMEWIKKWYPLLEAMEMIIEMDNNNNMNMCLTGVMSLASSLPFACSRARSVRT